MSTVGRPIKAVRPGHGPRPARALTLAGAIAVRELLAAAVVSVMLAGGRALEDWAARRARRRHGHPAGPGHRTRTLTDASCMVYPAQMHQFRARDPTADVCSDTRSARRSRPRRATAECSLDGAWFDALSSVWHSSSLNSVTDSPA